MIERLQEALQPAFDWRSDLLLEQERLQELQSASDAFSVTERLQEALQPAFSAQERLQEALQPAFDWRSDLLLEQERLQELQSASDAFSALQPAFDERLQEALQPAFDWRSDLLLEQERLQAALKPAFDVEERLQDAARVVELIEYNHERAMHATRETARMLSAQEDAARVVELIEYNHERAMLNAERTLSASIQASQELQPMMHERMASLIEGTEFAQERKQRMLLEREEDTDEEFTELHSLDESQWVEVIKFAQQKNRYSKIEIVKGRVVNTAWTLTPSVCFELIKLLISDGDQQLIYLMEKIKDLPVEEISKVLEEIYKNIGGFLL